MMNIQNFFVRLPIVTRRLLLVNIAIWLIDILFAKMGIIDLTAILGLWHFTNPLFHIWQPITYMFMHGGFSHLFFNMFALMMFGMTLEQYWGSRRFLIYYLLTGIGAGLFQELVWTLMATPFIVTVGASGAVYGILLAFAWLFPNNQMFIFPFPFPIKAKWFVLIFFAIELFEGFRGGDGVAHFAHLGGMLWGIILILWWKKKGVNTGEGLFDTWKIKHWWNNFISRFKPITTEESNHRTYHYQEPIQTETEEDKRQRERREAKEKEINRILDKIKLSGYDSLTQEEKKMLFNR